MMSGVSADRGDRRFRTQGPGLAVALLVSVVVLGTVGYWWIEHWTVWHAFYVTVLGITTVDLPPMSRGAQVFTVFLLFAGVGASLYTFTLLATVVVEGGLPKRLQRRREATRSRITSSSAATGALAPSSRNSSAGSGSHTSSSSAIPIACTPR